MPELASGAGAIFPDGAPLMDFLARTLQQVYMNLSPLQLLSLLLGISERLPLSSQFAQLESVSGCEDVEARQLLEQLRQSTGDLQTASDALTLSTRHSSAAAGQRGDNQDLGVEEALQLYVVTRCTVAAVAWLASFVSALFLQSRFDGCCRLLIKGCASSSSCHACTSVRCSHLACNFSLASASNVQKTCRLCDANLYCIAWSTYLHHAPMCEQRFASGGSQELACI